MPPPPALLCLKDKTGANRREYIQLEIIVAGKQLIGK